MRTYILIGLLLKLTYNIHATAHMFKHETLAERYAFLLESTKTPQKLFDEAYELYTLNCGALDRLTLNNIITKLYLLVNSRDSSPELLGDSACLFLVLNRADLCFSTLQKLLNHPYATQETIELYKTEIETIESKPLN